MLIRAERHFAGKSHHCWLLLPILYHAISPLYSESDSDTREKFEDTCFTKLKHYTFRVQHNSSSFIFRAMLNAHKQAATTKKELKMQTIQVSKVSRFLVVCFNLIILRREFGTFKISVSFLRWKEKKILKQFFFVSVFRFFLLKIFSSKFSCWLAQCIAKREPEKMWTFSAKIRKILWDRKEGKKESGRKCSMRKQRGRRRIHVCILLP